MPELEDTVCAYFPTKDEGEGIAFSSIRTKDLGSDKLSDTGIKYLRTKYGKELKFAPGEL